MNEVKIMKQKLLSFLTFLLVLCISTYNTTSVAQSLNSYLSKPSGQYGVAFEDFHWINQNNCPDFNFNGTNQDDFSPNNTSYCHEIVTRIYYPIVTPSQLGVLYYPPFIKTEQEGLSHVPDVTPEQVQQLSTIRSYSVEKAPIIAGKKFPVLLFSPGFGCPAELYENFITELVSQGYIVVSISTPFINFVALPNGHIVNAAQIKDHDEIEKKFVPLQAEDVSYVYEKIFSLHSLNPLFSIMDLKHIGAFGHSIGARVIADVAHTHPNWFQAAATLDIGSDTTGESQKKFNIPFMHAISSNRISESPLPVNFELGKNGYLVGFSPNEQDHDYSYHMNFSDISTLVYLPAYQVYLEYLNKQGAPPVIGTANGWELTHSINTYLVKFFDAFLKDDEDPAFRKCTILTNNSYIRCGPSTINSWHKSNLPMVIKQWPYHIQPTVQKTNLLRINETPK